MGEHTSAIMCGRSVVGYFLAIPTDYAALVRCEIMAALPDLLGEPDCILRPERWRAMAGAEGVARLVDRAGMSVVVITCPEHARKIMSRIATDDVAA